MQTTYFARAKSLPKDLNLVSIARITPSGFPGRIYLDLAPSEELLFRTKRTGDLVQYTKEYMEQLTSLDVHKVAKDLGDDAVLVCYERDDKFCHRHLVATWLKSNGYTIAEYKL